MAPQMRAFLRFLGLTAPDARDEPIYTPPAAPTVVGADIHLKGELHGDGPVVLLGHFEGEIVLNEGLHVGPEAQIDANITAASIAVAGAVRGHLSADTRVEILPGGSLTGTVRSGSFAAADGASVKGEVWIDRAESRPAPSSP